jgi:hypothetical protein
MHAGSSNLFRHTGSNIRVVHIYVADKQHIYEYMFDGQVGAGDIRLEAHTQFEASVRDEVDDAPNMGHQFRRHESRPAPRMKSVKSR